MSVLKLNNISKAFGGKTVLDKISLELNDGELLVMLGPSGCGKSTLLRIIAGLETPDNGEIYVDDKRIDGLAPKDRNMALVFQNYALYPHMTVEKNIGFPLSVAGIPKEEKRARIKDVAEILGLFDKLNHRPGQLSGGERQRVALGRAIIREPAVFLLDEPLSNLDAELRGRMRREIVELQKRLRKTLIHVTHDQTEALTMADRIALMNNGEIIQIGSPQELYSNPVNLFAAGFVGHPQINTFEARLTNDVLTPLGLSIGYLNLKFDTENMLVGIRPEKIRISEKGQLEAKVESLEYHGSQTLLSIELSGIRLKLLTPESTLSPGVIIRVFFPLESLMFFDPITHARLS
jgi:ABC-type sugar transport system ATPase subunit